MCTRLFGAQLFGALSTRKPRKGRQYILSCCKKAHSTVRRDAVQGQPSVMIMFWTELLCTVVLLDTVLLHCAGLPSGCGPSGARSSGGSGA